MDTLRIEIGPVNLDLTGIPVFSLPEVLQALHL